MRRNLRARVAPALAGATALIATACGGGDAGATPGEQLAAAMTELSAEDVAWSMTFDATSGALAGATGQVDAVDAVAPFLTSFAIRGEKVGDDASLTVNLMGADVVTMRSIDDGDQYFLRLDVQGLLDLGQIDSQELVAELGAQGLPESLLGTLSAAIGGQWIAFEGDFDALSGAYGTSEDQEQMEEALDAVKALLSDPAEVLERIGTVTSTTAEDGSIVYDVVVDVAALGEFLKDELAPALADAGADAPTLDDMRAGIDLALQDAPANIGGLTVTTREGRVVEIAIDIRRVAEAFGEGLPEGEDASLVFAFQRDGLSPIEVPDAAVTLTSEDIEGLFGMMMSGMPGA